MDHASLRPSRRPGPSQAGADLCYYRCARSLSADLRPHTRGATGPFKCKFPRNSQAGCGRAGVFFGDHAIYLRTLAGDECEAKNKADYYASAILGVADELNL